MNAAPSVLAQEPGNDEALLAAVGTLLQQRPPAEFTNQLQSPPPTPTDPAPTDPGRTDPAHIDVVIDFEEYPANDWGTPAAAGDADFYARYGLRLGAAYTGLRFRNTEQFDLAGFARSGSNVLVGCYSQEFCRESFSFVLDPPVYRFGVWLGSDRGQTTRSVGLRAFDPNGDEITRTIVELEPGQRRLTPVDVNAVVVDPASEIARVELVWITDNPFESGLALDDIELTYQPPAPPTPTPEPTATPEPTTTAAPTTPPEPTMTPVPTMTPEPTMTPAPTITPEPTGLARPTEQAVVVGPAPVPPDERGEGAIDVPWLGIIALIAFGVGGASAITALKRARTSRNRNHEANQDKRHNRIPNVDIGLRPDRGVQTVTPTGPVVSIRVAFAPGATYRLTERGDMP